jgi:hypothetical protein
MLQAPVPTEAAPKSFGGAPSPVLAIACAEEERNACCHFTPEATPEYFNAGFYVMTPRCTRSDCFTHTCYPAVVSPVCAAPGLHLTSSNTASSWINPCKAPCVH